MSTQRGIAGTGFIQVQVQVPQTAAEASTSETLEQRLARVEAERATLLEERDRAATGQQIFREAAARTDKDLKAARREIGH